MYVAEKIKYSNYVTMKRAEWQKLKTDNSEGTGFEAHNKIFSGPSFIYQYIGANNSKLGCRTTPFNNGNQQLGR